MSMQLLAVAATALSAIGVNGAAPESPTAATQPPACEVTQAKHARYTRTVYRERKRISARARRRMTRLKDCAKSEKAERNMVLLRRREARAREERREAEATPFRFAMASYYGPGLFGNALGCGGTLTTKTMGVAHKTLACGTVLDVCERRCATVRVVDRGPYVAGREVDLTMATASVIGFSGVGLVRLRVAR